MGTVVKFPAGRRPRTLLWRPRRHVKPDWRSRADTGRVHVMPAATRGVVTVTLWSRDDLDATDAAPTCDVVQEYDTRDGVWTVARGILRQYGIPDHVSGTADDGVAEATAWLEPHAGPDGTGRVEQWLEIRGPEAFVDAVVARLLTARDVRELV